jgi:two-component system response regulator FixJ
MNNGHMHGKVFVIDDDGSARKALLRLMRAAGYEAYGLEDAAAYLSGNVPARPACLIVDVRMPGLNGLELRQRLTDSPLSVPIVFITGHGADEIRSEGQLREPIEVLEKPLDGRTLLAAVERALAASVSAPPRQA